MKMIATIKAIDRHPFSYSSSSDGVFSLYQSNGCFDFISRSFLSSLWLYYKLTSSLHTDIRNSRIFHYTNNNSHTGALFIPPYLS